LLKKRIEKWFGSHYRVRFALTYLPLFLGSAMAIVFGDGITVDENIALAAFRAEIQVFAMFAALTPIFFAFAEIRFWHR